MLLLLLACAGAPADDTAPLPADDTGGDTAPAAPNLAEADTLLRGDASTAVGSAVAAGGDLDGDGLADVLVSAFYGNRVCAWYGALPGGTHALTDGACLEGEATYDFAGYAATRAPLDGPGLAVTAIGNDDAGIEAGKVYWWRGAPPLGASPLADAPVTWVGEAAGDYAGTSVAWAGDVDDDGAPELLVGASGCDAGGSGGGRVYVVDAPSEDGVYLLGDAATTLTGSSTTPTAFLHGAATGGDAIGEAVAGLGDLDGDGVDDLAVGGGGAGGGGAESGEVWVLNGPVVAGDFRSADVDIRLIGPGPGAYAGAAIGAPGDLDGDGLADLAVAADGWEGGLLYVLFGPVGAGDTALGTAPVVLAGETEEDLAGWALSGAGDTDGDGVRELIVGVPGHDGMGGEAGAVYLVRDPASPGRRSLGEAVRWEGEAARDAAGRAAAGVGDTNGDGLDDVLVGALYNQEGGVFAGAAYLLLGG